MINYNQKKNHNKPKIELSKSSIIDFQIKNIQNILYYIFFYFYPAKFTVPSAFFVEFSATREALALALALALGLGLFSRTREPL